MTKNKIGKMLLVVFFVLAACKLPGDLFPTEEPPPPENTAVPAPPTEEPIPPTDAPTATPDPYAGWLTYINQDHGYQFDYPPGATINVIGVSSYPTADLPAGMTPSDYMLQLQQTYGDKLCVAVNYLQGYVNISAPVNTQFAYTLCGRTGVGVGTMTDKVEQVTINGNIETAEGFEFYGGSEILDNHNETLVLYLADLTRIEYGAGPDSVFTYANYLTNTKDVLLLIVESYRPYP